MEKLINLWYRCVAKQLLFKYHLALNDAEQWKRRADLFKKDLVNAEHPLTITLDNVRHRAAQQRISDLEKELKQLKDKID